ncbi:hypothetical protein [Superficieibacter sp.]|uniref:gp53-like domain-containing protein n=1 Tax=Superficieibacter sp. TaxID=2303322 RepID=UPI0028A73037|nr:hypothetical protein [Superficieibacter sp.]
MTLRKDTIDKEVFLAFLLSRLAPGTDIKKDAKTADFLTEIGMGTKDSPAFSGITAPTMMFYPKMAGWNAAADGSKVALTVGGTSVLEVSKDSLFHSGTISAGKALKAGQATIAEDGNISGTKWGGWLDAFLKDGISTDGNGLWWNAALSSLKMRIGAWSIPGSSGGDGVSITFPQAFPNACLIVIPIPSTGGASEQIGCQGFNKTGAVIQKGASDTNPRSGKYLAIGY